MVPWFNKPALLLLGLLLSFLFPAHLRAASVAIKTAIGFDGRFQLGRPFPIKVTLVNTSQPVEGTLEVQLWKRGASKAVDAYPISYQRQIFLAAQARKSVVFTIDPDFVSRPVRISFTSSKQEVTEEVDLRPHYSTQPLLLLVSGTNAPLSIPLPSALTNPLITVPLSELPSDPRAYLGVWALLFYEQPLRELSRAQVFSLEAWIAWGGRALALGGLNYAVFQDPTWARFLPVSVSGLARLPRLSNLEKAYGKAIAKSQIWADQARVVEGKELLQEGGHPMIVEASRGRGKVVFVSLDVGRPPLSHWEGLPRFFGDLLGSPPEQRMTWDTTWDDAVFSRVLSSPSFLPNHAPALGFLLWAVSYLVTLILLVRYWQIRQAKPPFLVAAFFPLVGLFCASGHLYFDRDGKTLDGILFSSTLLESVASGYAEAQSNIAVFSMRQRPYRLQLDNAWRDLELVTRQLGRSEQSSLSMLGESLSNELDFSLGEWSYSLFRIRSLQRLPLRVESEIRNDVIKLEIVNQSSRELAECWFVVSGKSFFLDKIPAHAQRTWEFPLGAADSTVGKDPRDISFSDPIRGLLFRNSFFPDQIRAKDKRDAAVFFGWVREGPRGAWVNDHRVYNLHYTLYRATFPLQREEEL